ncbi:hypothetical protein HD554DRAFT_2015772 [Boletus coccyginus]|nr:hypothetical protein HD554DRAFT_2015772 [Boletus coccyginus]
MTATSSSSPDAHTVAPEDNSPLPLVSQEVYSPEGTVVEISSVELEVIRLSLSLEPHPPYESCSPLHRSVFKGDDSDSMDFVPFADDHTFDQTSHAQHYESFSWQNPFDPDLEVVALEAVYRLQTQYALTYDEVEDCNVLPLRLRSRPGIPGLLSTVRRRDRLDWAGNTIPISYTFPPSTWSERSDFRSRLTTLNSVFCPNLSCIEPLCSVHVEPNPMPPRLRPPLSRFLGEVLSPCQNQCFISNRIKEPSPSWDEADIDMFRVISEVSPNTTSCDIAVLCLKPCYEVFYYRKLLYSCISEEAQPAGLRNQRRIPRFNDRDPAQFTPNDPCHHIGPCSSSSSCPCFTNRSRCQRNCSCSPECNRRWRGCRCSKVKSRWSCMTETCPCVEALRECDPELCVNCRCILRILIQRPLLLGILADDTLCRNSQILHGAHKDLEAKKSSWGLGTFLAEAAKAGDLITEYVGEMIYEPTVESRADLAAHRNRCYVFGLNNTFSLDATYAGNISRFIDHSDAGRSKRVNSQARVRLVNGDHRIGVFAIRDMEAGSQVLMNYGSEFFVK